MAVERLNLSDLKRKSPKDLVALAEELEIETHQRCAKAK